MQYTQITYNTALRFAETMADRIAVTLTMPLDYSVNTKGTTVINLAFLRDHVEPDAMIECYEHHVDVYDFTRRRTFSRAWRRWAPFSSCIKIHEKCPTTVRADEAMFPQLSYIIRRNIEHQPIARSEAFDLHRKCINAGAWSVASAIWKLFIAPTGLSIPMAVWLAERLSTNAKGGVRQ